MTKNQTQIIVIGAGYAGLLATVRLAGKTRNQDVAITLVNSSDMFIERLRLHQFAANRTFPLRPLADTLRGTGVKFVQGFVSGIDSARHEIVVRNGGDTRRLAYNKLVYALGSTIDRDSVDGVRANAFTLTPTGPLSADALREILPSMNERQGRVLVCGGGATGIEAAAEFAGTYPKLRVQLVTRGALGMFLGKDVADYMHESLERRGVTIQDHTTVTRVEADRALTANGTSIPFDLCLWAGGFGVPSLARESGLAVNERGQMLIDPFMRSISDPDIYAVGDAAHPVETPGVHVRMSALTAVIMGAHGADCLSAVVKGKSPQPFSFAYYGQAIALGPYDAIGFGSYPDDIPNHPYFTGRAGYEVRDVFVRLLAALPDLEKRVPGIFYWFGKGRYAASKRNASMTVRVHQV